MSTRNRRSSPRTKTTSPADQTAKNKSNNNVNTNNVKISNHDHSEEVTSTTTLIPAEVIVHGNEIVIDDKSSINLIHLTNLKRSGSNNSISDSNNDFSNNNYLSLNSNSIISNDNLDIKAIIKQEVDDSYDNKLIEVSNHNVNNNNGNTYTLSTQNISVIKETSSLTSTTTTIGDTIVAVVPVIQTITTGNNNQQSIEIYNHHQQQLQRQQQQRQSTLSSVVSSSPLTISTTKASGVTTASTIIHDEITKALGFNNNDNDVDIKPDIKPPLRVIVTTETRPGPSGLTTPKSSSSSVSLTTISTLSRSSPSTTVSTAQNNSFEAADSNSGNTPSKSFVMCKVCGDKASGYHYGVTSCEGCKGFFRRSIQKQIEYKCLRDGKCLVIRLNRNRCQYCRFKKCLSVGMSRDSVRYGRVPKRSREKSDDNRVTTSETDQNGRELENMQLAMYEIILTISQAHHAHCAYTEEKVRELMRKPAIFSLDEYNSSPSECSPSSVTADSLEQQKINMWQRFADFITPSISRVVEFAKRIPGFLELSQDDQLILIKSGFFEIWIVHVSRMVNAIDNTLTFCDGNYITRQQMELMFDHEFVSSIFNFMLSFNSLHLNDTEIGLFAALALLSLERYGIYDAKAIHRIQEKIYEALRLQIVRHHSGDTSLHPNVMMRMPELRTLGIKHCEHLSWFRANWTRLKLPPLFAEIFDIPKSEDELLLVAQ